MVIGLLWRHRRFLCILSMGGGRRKVIVLRLTQLLPFLDAPQTRGRLTRRVSEAEWKSTSDSIRTCGSGHYLLHLCKIVIVFSVNPPVALQVALVAAAVRARIALEFLFPRVDGKVSVTKVLPPEDSVAQITNVTVTVHCSVVLFQIPLIVEHYATALHLTLHFGVHGGDVSRQIVPAVGPVGTVRTLKQHLGEKILRAFLSHFRCDCESHVCKAHGDYWRRQLRRREGDGAQGVFMTSLVCGRRWVHYKATD